MTTNEILSDLDNKGFSKIVNKIKKLTAMDQLNLELECTGYLRDLVDYVNKHVLEFSTPASYGRGLEEDGRR